MNENTKKKADEVQTHAVSVFGVLKPKPQKKVTYVTVREEKKHLRRIVKAKPKAIKHRADALRTKVSDQDIDITKKVLDGVTSSAKPHTSPPVDRRTFTCAECNTKVPMDSETCPRCRVKFLHGITDEELAELNEAEHQTTGEPLDHLDPKSLPVVHFDAKTGVMNYLENDQGEADFVLECSHCGTLVQLSVDRCPICGTALETGDTGIVSLFADMDFNGESMPEADCPFCGEHVMLESGVCPSCKSVVEGDEQPGGRLTKVNPLLQAENIVFLHLDIETGDLNYLQRLANKITADHASVELDGLGSSAFQGDWSGLQRI